MNDYRKLVGQRMVVGFYGTEVNDDIRDLICNYKIGNIILFKHNVLNNNQLKAMCSELQDLVKLHTGHDAFITIDQEGGIVTRLGEDALNIPGAMAIAATRDVRNAYEAGRLTGLQLRNLGINFNLAPTVDVNSNMHNPVIGVRSYGDKPYEAAKYAVEMTKGLLAGHVYACGKHFPGHGDTNVDSHVGLPLINKELEELEECELIPFKKVIEAGIPAIMTTHILFPKIEEENIPATMSRKIITGILREKLKFTGLIVSDCMEMSAIKKYYGTVEGSLAAIKAGVDLVFISHTASVAREVSDALVSELKQGGLSLSTMTETVDRILEYKSRLNDPSMQLNNQAEIEDEIEKGKEFVIDLTRKTITALNMPSEGIQLGSTPLFIGTSAFRASNVSNEEEELNFANYLSMELGGSRISIDPNPSEEDIEAILGEAKGKSAIIIGTYNGHLFKGQLELVRKLSQVHENIVVIALRNPYDLAELPEHCIKIAAYEYTAKSLRVICELLENKFHPSGDLAVEL